MNKQEIKILKEHASSRILELLDTLEMTYFSNNFEIRSVCPIHHGDNCVAWSWSFYHSSWKCWTRSCHYEWGTDVIGLVKGVKQCSFKEAIDFLSKFVRKPISASTGELSGRAPALILNEKSVTKKIPLCEVISRMKLDDQYYVNRGLSLETIQRYNIGICNNRQKKFYKRAVIPVLHEDGHHVVGFTARSIFEQCDKCKGYHDPDYQYCPRKPQTFSKWKHSVGFARNDFLYNYWFSKHHIRKLKTAILVEGPGDCFALEQAGIHNSVGLFGLSISSKQKSLLQKVNAVHVILCMDNDDAGRKASAVLTDKLSHYFKVSTTLLCAKDIGEMEPKAIRSSLCCPIN